jgi:hypothetical protein
LDLQSGGSKLADGVFLWVTFINDRTVHVQTTLTATKAAAVSFDIDGKYPCRAAAMMGPPASVSLVVELFARQSTGQLWEKNAPDDDRNIFELAVRELSGWKIREYLPVDYRLE